MTKIVTPVDFQKIRELTGFDRFKVCKGIVGWCAMNYSCDGVNQYVFSESEFDFIKNPTLKIENNNWIYEVKK